MTVVVNRPVPDLTMPVAVATPGRVHFSWSNPAMHDGVLILRSVGAAHRTRRRRAGRRYPAGTALGNATVVYEDALSFNTSFADTGLTNGTVYYYRALQPRRVRPVLAGQRARAQPEQLPAGDHPGHDAAATRCGARRWGCPRCSSRSPTSARPSTSRPTAATSPGNVITVGAPVNGNEKWRPSLTRGRGAGTPDLQRGRDLRGRSGRLRVPHERGDRCSARARRDSRGGLAAPLGLRRGSRRTSSRVSGSTLAT